MAPTTVFQATFSYSSKQGAPQTPSFLSADGAKASEATSHLSVNREIPQLPLHGNVALP